MKRRRNVLAHALPTRSMMAALLAYDATSGAFAWRVTAAHGGVRAGDSAGYICARGYRIIRVQGRNYKAHRLAWLLTHGQWPTADIDHINGIRQDNRLANLRDVSRQINQQNRRTARPGKAIALLGAFRSNSKWKAEIKVNGVNRYLGTFDTAEEAHAAYVEAKRVHHAGCTL